MGAALRVSSGRNWTDESPPDLPGAQAARRREEAPGLEPRLAASPEGAVGTAGGSSCTCARD